MKKWNLLDQASTPDGKAISLLEQDGGYLIRVNRAELMSTRQHSSEELLARLACEPVKARPRPRVLIGGLGFGFTLRAALAVLGPDATVVVAEILPAVIAWNRNPAYPFAADAMTDPRVIVRKQDVAEAIGASRRVFDAIALDVDNGPNPLTTDDNFQLYDSTGLQRARAALRPGGCLALWSAAPDPAFERLMAGAGFTVRVEHCRSNGKSGRRHTIFVGHPRP